MSEVAQSGRPLAKGAIAGILTVAAFTVLHQILISNIWFSFVPMVVAGAACGGSLAWSYGLLFRPASPKTWWGFVALHTGLLLLLGGASVVLFDPVVPMAVLIAANEPPSELIAQAVPLTAVFIVGAAAVPSLLWGRTIQRFASNLVASALLVILLGLNVSVLGLVDTSGGSSFVVLEFLALLVVIMLSYGLLFHWLERRGLLLTVAEAGPPSP